MPVFEGEFHQAVNPRQAQLLGGVGPVQPDQVWDVHLGQGVV